MHEVNADCALAHSGRNPLNVTGSHITDCEYAGQTGLKHLGMPCQGPATFGDRIQIPSRQDESSVIQHNGITQPFGAWRGSSHDEEVPDIAR